MGGVTVTAWPLRWKVTAAFAGALMVVLTAVGAFVYLRFAAELTSSTDYGLRARAEELAQVAARRGGELPLTVPRAPGLEADESIAHVLRGDGAVLAATSHPRVRLLDAASLAAARRGEVVVDRPGDAALDESLRVLARPVRAPAGDLVVAVASSNDEKREALASLLALMVIGLGAALLASSAAGYVVAGLALRPVEALRRRAEEITASGDELLPVPPVDDELGRLGTTLNAMLIRLRHAQSAEREALTRERRFVAEASHQLRTPLTIMRAELELALLDGTGPGGHRAALESSLEETDRLARLTGHLLLLAAADESRLDLDERAVDVGDLLRTVVSRYRRGAETDGRRLATHSREGVTLTADGLRLEQALGNLVDNALRHGAGDVRLSAEVTDDGVVITVTDDGPGFPEAFLDHAFERFRAGGGGNGSGLGLSVVRAVAEAHGGTVRAANHPGPGAGPGAGSGATVDLLLPRTPTPTSPPIKESGTRDQGIPVVRESSSPGPERGG